MECIRCSTGLAEPIPIHGVSDLELCDVCAKEFNAIQRQAVAPLIVAAFEQFVSDWSTALPEKPRSDETADRFWVSLMPFGPIDLDDIASALEALVARAPREANIITD